MTVTLIAAMAENRVIGKEGAIPWHLPDDLARFKSLTLGHPVVMGRKTFESIGRPLPGRRNLVISRNPGFKAPGIEVFSSIDEVLATLSEAESPEELMVIGGGHLYGQLLPRADRLYLTHIDLAVAGDTRFPAFDDEQWLLVESEAHPADEKNPHPYRFEIWQRC